MAREFIAPKGVHKARGYSHAVKIGNAIYVAGQVGADEKGSAVPGGFQAQAEKAFENLRLVLEAAGASFKDVVKLNTYLTNMSDRPAFAEIRNRYVSDPPPASTLVQVSSLAHPSFLIEVEAVAVLDA